MKHLNVTDKDNQQTNEEIKCDVKNCVYHDSNNYCTAEHINVGPTYANSSADTVCVTFRSK